MDRFAPDNLPARLTVEEVAPFFHTTTEGIYILSSLKVLKPLGHPRRNCTKYYSRSYILRLASDEAWLGRMTDALVNYKWDKNHGAPKKERVTS
jgi:hypothetical protein